MLSRLGHDEDELARNDQSKTYLINKNELTLKLRAYHPSTSQTASVGSRLYRARDQLLAAPLAPNPPPTARPDQQIRHPPARPLTGTKTDFRRSAALRAVGPSYPSVVNHARICAA